MGLFGKICAPWSANNRRAVDRSMCAGGCWPSDFPGRGPGQGRRAVSVEGVRAGRVETRQHAVALLGLLMLSTAG